MKTIKLNNQVTMDISKLISGKLLLQANTGGGKSYATRRILEQSFGIIPHIILDTEGEFATLREKYDYILIGKGYDIAADPKTAAKMALRLWEERVSAIIDLYELSPWDRQVFVKNFTDAMVNAPKNLWKPVLLVIDEAHEYAPETDKSDSGRALHLLASKGRKRQIGVIFATQRISALSKNVVAACKNKLIGQASLDTDMKRSAGELGFTTKEQFVSIRNLEPGEFYAFGPAISKEVIKVKIGKVFTSHGDDSSTIGTVAPASAKVKAALAKLADLPQEIEEEANTIKSLQNKIKELKAENVRIAREPDLDLLERAKTEARQEAGLAWEKVLKNWKKYFQSAKIVLPETAPLDIPEGWMTPSNLMDVKTIIKVPRPVFEKLRDRFSDGFKGTQYIDADSSGVIGKGEIAVLKEIATHNSLTRDHITLLTGYKRSTRDAYIKRLMSRGLVGQEGNYIYATEDGFNYLGPTFQAIPKSFDDLVLHYQNTLPEGERKIFEYLIPYQETYVSRDDISESTGYKRSTRDAYIKRLATRKIVEVSSVGIRLAKNFYEY